MTLGGASAEVLDHLNNYGGQQAMLLEDEDLMRDTTKLLILLQDVDSESCTFVTPRKQTYR